jgi:uncharacterized protein (DUF302 family)
MRSLDTVVNQPIDRAENAMREALAAQGFGVPTEIDVATTFKAKLGVSGPPLKILGPCNPALARRAGARSDGRLGAALQCRAAWGGLPDLHLDR